MKQIAKKTINKFGEHYLLGVNKAGEKVWLERESWDCEWYWGFGYLHTFTNERDPMRSKDIASHFHFDSAFLDGRETAYEKLEDYFEAMTIPEGRLYELVDLMMSAYALKKAATLFHHGCSWQTEKAKIAALKNKELEDQINGEMLPQVFDRIRKLLTED